ncbi:hypothetical protein ZWY2020_027774 [Hordeum vulgare]|nr:hypothetical protein ZWY2020_027774 [Hordeum vulgare]
MPPHPRSAGLSPSHPRCKRPRPSCTRCRRKPCRNSATFRRPEPDDDNSDDRADDDDRGGATDQPGMVYEVTVKYRHSSIPRPLLEIRSEPRPSSPAGEVRAVCGRKQQSSATFGGSS